MEWTTWTPVLTLPLGALVLLVLQKVSKLGLGKFKAREKDNRRRDLDSQTFRLQGIPSTFEGHGTTRKDVEKLVREAYAVEGNIQISVKSLASHPIRREEKVATLNFSRTPLRLAKTSKAVQEFDCIPPFKVLLDIHFHGLTPLHSHDEPKCDLEVVALSGPNGHAFGSFIRKDGNYMWLRDDLCHSLPHARVYVYGYRMEREGSESFQSLDDLGLSFKLTLKALLKSKDNNCSPNPLVLIGHSLGGLVIKQALCQMSESKVVDERSILKSIQGIMFFGTPNQGMGMPSLVSMIQGQLNESFVCSLGLDSTELRQQTKQWFHIFQLREGDKVSSAMEIISFYETRNSPMAIKVNGEWRMGGKPAKLVDRNSATHGRPFDSDEHYVQPIGRSHSELVRFNSSTDEVYSEKVLPLLKKFYETAKERSPVLLLSQAQHQALEHCRSSFSSPWERTRAGQIVEAENSTCTWLLRHPTYEDWLQQNRALLWLQGVPGAGKSTIMKHTVELMQTNPPKDAAIASFFIYGLGVDLQKTLRGLYCSLIRQLLPQVPFAFLPMLAKVEDIHEPASLGPLDLQKYFKQALAEASKTRPIILFIDAINELSTANEERETLLDILRDLCYGKKYSSLKINICVSSRYYPNLYNRGLIIPVEENSQKDIAAFVQYSLQDLPEEVKNPLVENIIKKANGVFQWVRLVCKEARELYRKGKKLSVIMSNIAAIPQDLYLLYDKLFEEMTAKDMAQSLKLFRWVAFSNRMINLRELQHVLALAPDMTEQSLEEYSNSENFLDQLGDLKNTVKDLSKGLVGFEGAHERDGDQAWGERVRLIHFTVMDYLCDRGLKLLEKGTKSADVPPEGAAHYYITLSSFRYIFMRGTREDFDTRQMSSSRFPLDHLVQTSIEYHLQSAERYGVDQFELLRIFGWPNEKNAIASFRTFVTRFNDPPLIHILAACGVLSTLRAMIHYSPEDQAATNHNTEMYSLVSACQGELFQADVFLPSGQVNLDIMNSQSNTPLHFALNFEQPEAAHELLQSNRVDVNALNYYRKTPLHVAANTGILAAVQDLLNRPDVNPNAQDVYGQTVLHNAIDGSKDDVIKILLQSKKVNPNARDKDGRTPLHMAANAADIDIVDILLQSGKVDVNIKDKKGQTPLFAFILGYAGYGADASEHGELADVLSRLLSHPKIEPRAKDKMQRTPLFYAATEGLELFARILVEGGRGGAADKDKLGRTPLSQAAAKGHEEIVRRFLAAEDFDEEDLRFAYEEAKKKGRTEVMRRLVDTGKVTER